MKIELNAKYFMLNSKIHFEGMFIMTNSKEVTETVETQHTWQDHLFPDNPKRRKRVEQLMSECADYTNVLADKNCKLKTY